MKRYVICFKDKDGRYFFYKDGGFSYTNDIRSAKGFSNFDSAVEEMKIAKRESQFDLRIAEIQ